MTLVLQLHRSFSLLIISVILTASYSNSVRAQESNKPWSARPDVVERFSKQRGQFNYDESKVPEYTLPNPLIAADGTPVTTPEVWNASRRAELMELFREHVYGRRPDLEYTIGFKQTAELKDAFDGKATGRSMTATITVANRSFTFPFVVFVPNDVEKPVPAVVHINNRYFIPLEQAATEHDPFWPAKTLIERGYATASFHTSDVDPDKKDGYADGIRSFFANGRPPEDKAWRSLSAWGWGASRVLDHLDTLDAVDGERVAVVGHSRGGKASLWAACEDTRFAIAYSNDSGCGGAALSRRAYGETVGRITSSFPHWFCVPYSRYADREDRLPVDQHEVIALIAPRGVYVASADEDLWADPKGEYASVVAAAPVFQLLGQQSIVNPEMPPLNQPRVAGQTGYHIRTGGHGLGDEDWNWFLDFADRVLRDSARLGSP
ncbi:MAG TPA: acetylxylan esterase [Planctomycetaceae bacterium]|nr:acetylxylan esterase [Planctomycetaceae bacterium]